MALAKILFQGMLDAKHISVQVNPISQRSIDSDIENKVEGIWENCIKTAKENGQKIWNAEHYRLDDYSFNDGILHLELSTISYKVITAMRYLPEVALHKESYFPDALAIDAIIRTKDGKYILGKASSLFFASNNSFKFIGGGVVKDEGIVKKSDDLFSALYREIDEEAAIQADQIEKMVLTGMFRTKQMHVALLCFADLLIDSATVQQQFNIKHDGEMESLVFSTWDDLFQKIKEMDEYDEVFSQALESIYTYAKSY